MSGREVVQQWLFEYTCRHRLSRAMAEIAFNHSNVWSSENCSIPSIYVLLAFITEVINEQLIPHYDVVIKELTRLCDASGDIIPFKAHARLLVTLKVAVLFDMLEKENKLALPRLNSYFPRKGFQHEKADDDFKKRLSEGQKHFRGLFLRLLSDKKQRKEYFRTQFDLEYGVKFVNCTKQLLKQIIDAIDASLPACAIDRLLGKNADQQLVDEITAACSPSFEMLLDAVDDKDFLTESQVIDLLRNLNPSSTNVLPSFPFVGALTSIVEESENQQPETSHAPLPKESSSKRGLHCSSPAAKRQRVSDVDIFGSDAVPCSKRFEHIRFAESSQSVESAASAARLNTISQLDAVSSSVEDSDLKIMSNFSPVSSEISFSNDPKSSSGLREPDTRRNSCIMTASSQQSLEGSSDGYTESFVSDSEFHSRLDKHEALIVPSSYSFDQFDMSLGGDRSRCLRLPPIEKYLHVDLVGDKICVVRLFRNKKLDRNIEEAVGVVNKMYS